MSDDIFDGDEETGGEEGGQRRGGLLSGLAIQILKWVAIVLGAIIFVVTTVVVTLNFLQADEPSGAEFPASDEYEEDLPSYDYFDGIGEIRGSTSDGVSTFIVEIELGYEEEDARTQQELSQRTPRIRDLVRNRLAVQTTEDLRPQNEPDLKADLEERINRLLSQGRVREVIFNEFQVVPF